MLLVSARRMEVEKVVGPPYQYPLEYVEAVTGELKLTNFFWLFPGLDFFPIIGKNYL